MMYKIYYTDPNTDKAYSWNERTLEGALGVTEIFRNRGMRFVTMVSENPDQVGKSGVDAVVNGKLPDGFDYTWKKRRT
jgi:hypothetical protein